MAKGDHKRVQDMIYDQQDKINSGQQNLDTSLNNAQQGFQNNYNIAAPQQQKNYGDIMNNYNSMFQNPRNPQIGAPSGGYNFNPNLTSGNFNGIAGIGSGGQDFGMPSNNSSMTKSGGGDQMSQFESALRELQQQDPVAAGKMTGDQLSQYMASKGINVSPFMYGNTQSGNEIVAPDGSKYKFRTDAGGIYNSSMDDGGGDGGSDQSLASYGLGNYPGALAKTISGYSDFADTGGFSPQDIQDLRARAVSPIRSIYSSAKDNLATARNASGGYMPNFAAANSQMARRMSNEIGDKNQAVDADIASMRQQGRLAGLSGLAGVGTFGAGLSNDITNSTMAGRNNALAGMTSLYGASPGAAGTYGSQVNQGNSNLVSGQNSRVSGAGTLIGGITNSAQVPGNFQSAVGNIGSALNLGASIINPLGSIFGKPKTTGTWV